MKQMSDEPWEHREEEHGGDYTRVTFSPQAFDPAHLFVSASQKRWGKLRDHVGIAIPLDRIPDLIRYLQKAVEQSLESLDTIEAESTRVDKKRRESA